MPGLGREARSLRIAVLELETASRTRTSKVRANRSTVDIEVVVEQTCTVRRSIQLRLCI